MLHHLLIIGATGDLAGRYLFPGLAELHAEGQLPEGFQVSGIGRQRWGTDQFRRHVLDRLAKHAAHVPAESQSAFAATVEYGAADVTDARQLSAALGAVHEPLVAYLALPPAIAADTVQALGEIRLPAGSRIVVEKPFGENLQSARALNGILGKYFSERDVFRVDHFLAMQTVQNITGLRFANRVVETLWNRDHIERVDIIWDETLTLEGRAVYYDAAGALRDMIQNHLLQLLCLICMEPPVTLAEHDFRDRKVDLLRSVRRITPEEASSSAVRARYTAGMIGDRQVPAYAEEEGIRPERHTETYAELRLWLDNWRWSGVPFVLRTGKALAADRKEIIVRFRPVPHLAFTRTRPFPNEFRLTFAPDCMHLAVNITGAGDPLAVEQTSLSTCLQPTELPVYARLLMDILEGESRLSVRADEAEEAWSIVEPVLEAWAANRAPLHEYPAGSDGPGVQTA